MSSSETEIGDAQQAPTLVNEPNNEDEAFYDATDLVELVESKFGKMNLETGAASDEEDDFQSLPVLPPVYNEHLQKLEEKVKEMEKEAEKDKEPNDDEAESSVGANPVNEPVSQQHVQSNSSLSYFDLPRRPARQNRKTDYHNY